MATTEQDIGASYWDNFTKQLKFNLDASSIPRELKAKIWDASMKQTPSDEFEKLLTESGLDEPRRKALYALNYEGPRKPPAPAEAQSQKLLDYLPSGTFDSLREVGKGAYFLANEIIPEEAKKYQERQLADTRAAEKRRLTPPPGFEEETRARIPQGPVNAPPITAETMSAPLRPLPPGSQEPVKRTMGERAGDVSRTLGASFNSVNASVWRLLQAGTEIGQTMTAPLEQASGAKNLMNLQGVNDWFKKQASGQEFYADALRVSQEEVSPFELAVYQGVESMGTNLLLLPLAVMSGGSAAPTLAGMGAVTAGQAYGQAREQGLAVPQATTYAFTQGVIEAVTEKIPLDTLLKSLGTKTGFGQLLMKELAQEIGTEQVATLFQDMNDWLNLNPNKTLSEFVMERPSAAASTLVSTVVGTVGLVGVTRAADRIVNRKPTQDIGIDDAQADQIRQGLESQGGQQQGPAEGMVRLYHGGAVAPDGGSRWVTPDLKYAQGYASKSGEAGKVYYVDIPADSPLLRKSFDDTDTGMNAPFVNFDAPPEIASQLQELPVEPQAMPTSPEVTDPASTGLTPPPGFAEWQQQQQRPGQPPPTATSVRGGEVVEEIPMTGKTFDGRRMVSDLAGIPDYVRDTINQDYEFATKNDLVDQIEDLSAQGLVAGQVVARLKDKLPADPMDQTRIVRSVRAKLGIPSQNDPAEFEEWRKGHEQRKSQDQGRYGPDPGELLVKAVEEQKERWTNILSLEKSIENAAGTTVTGDIAKVAHAERLAKKKEELKELKDLYKRAYQEMTEAFGGQAITDARTKIEGPKEEENLPPASKPAQEIIKGQVPAGAVDVTSGRTPPPTEEKDATTSIRPIAKPEAEIDAVGPVPPPSKRWLPDRGAIPGEPILYLDVQGDDYENGRGAIWQEESGDGVFYRGAIKGDDGEVTEFGPFGDANELAAAMEKFTDTGRMDGGSLPAGTPALEGELVSDKEFDAASEAELDRKIKETEQEFYRAASENKDTLFSGGAITVLRNMYLGESNGIEDRKAYLTVLSGMLDDMKAELAAKGQKALPAGPQDFKLTPPPDYVQYSPQERDFIARVDAIVANADLTMPHQQLGARNMSEEILEARAKDDSYSPADDYDGTLTTDYAKAIIAAYNEIFPETVKAPVYKFKVGDQVSFRGPGGKSFSGTVSALGKEGQYEVRYKEKGRNKVTPITESRLTMVKAAETPKPAPAGDTKVTPDRRLNIFRGKNGPVTVIFPDAIHADLFSFWGRMNRSIKGEKPFDFKHAQGQIAHFLGIDAEQVGRIAQTYKENIMAAIAASPSGSTFNAFRFDEGPAAAPTRTPPPGMADADDSLDATADFIQDGVQVEVKREGDEVTVTLRAENVDRGRITAAAALRTAGLKLEEWEGSHVITTGKVAPGRAPEKAPERAYTFKKVAAAAEPAKPLTNADIQRIIKDALENPDANVDEIVKRLKDYKPNSIDPDAINDFISEMKAFHGSPHKFGEFSLHKIGTGEGAQSYGWGLYFAGNKEVAEYYRDRVNRLTETSEGQLYKVEIPADSQYLEYDKPLSEQSPEVIEALERAGIDPGTINYPSLNQARRQFETQRVQRLAAEDIGIRESLRAGWNFIEAGDEKGFRKWFGTNGRLISPTRISESSKTGRDLYDDIAVEIGRQTGRLNYEGASRRLAELGIAGIKYSDQLSRGMVEGTYEITEEENQKLDPKSTAPPIMGYRLAVYPKDGSDVIFSVFGSREEAEDAAEEGVTDKITYNYVVFDDSLIKILESGPDVSEMRVGEGRAAASMDPRVIKVLGGNLYKGDLGVVTVREMIQNAVDSLLELPDAGEGVVAINVDGRKRTITVTDNGTGMLPAVATKELLDIGGSLKPKKSAGGFGIAKVAIFANADEIHIVTVADDPSTGKRVRTELTGSSQDWIDPKHGLKVETSETTDPTGTRIQVKLNDTTKMDAYQTSNYLKELDKTWRLPFTLSYGVTGYVESDNRNRKPIDYERRVQYSVPGAEVSLYVGDQEVISAYSMIKVHVLNRGIYQFDSAVIIGKEIPVAGPVILDISPTGTPEEANYPFMPDRDHLRDNNITIEAFAYIREFLAGAALRKDLERLSSRIESAPPVGTNDERLVDTAGVLDEDFVKELSNRPYLRDLADALHESMDELIDIINERRFGTKSMAAIQMPAFAIGLGESYLGLNVRGDAIGQKENLLLINPYTIASEILVAQKMGVIADADVNETIAGNFVATLIHELSHQEQRGHEEKMIGELTRNQGRTAKASARLTYRLESLLGDNNEAALTALVQDLKSLESQWGGEDVFRKVAAGATVRTDQGGSEGDSEGSAGEGAGSEETVRRSSRQPPEGVASGTNAPERALVKSLPANVAEDLLRLGAYQYTHQSHDAFNRSMVERVGPWVANYLDNLHNLLELSGATHSEKPTPEAPVEAPPPRAEEPGDKFKVEVIADNSGKWAGNAMVYDTKEEAEAAAQDLMMRWMAVREWRVVPMSKEEVVLDLLRKNGQATFNGRTVYITASQVQDPVDGQLVDGFVVRREAPFKTVFRRSIDDARQLAFEFLTEPLTTMSLPPAESEKPKPKTKFSNNTVFTEDKIKAAQERARKKLGTQLNVGFDPELMSDLFMIGGGYFEAGVREFGAWSAHMIEDLGDAVRPMLKTTFDALESYWKISVEPQPAEEPPADPYKALAVRVKQMLINGESFDNPKLTTLANEFFGGTRGEGKYDPRDAYDAVEAAVNMVISEPGFVDFVDTDGTLRRLRELTARLPRQADRTEEQIEFQQFSTPPEEAFVVVSAAGIRAGMAVLEPSAGTGNIATQARLAGAQVYANEIADRRLHLLDILGFPTTHVNGLHLNSLLPDGIQPDIVVMNPPFSATGGVAKGHKTEYGAQHVTEALARLKPGGRLVAVVGQGMGHDRQNFQEWWDDIYGKFNVRANIRIAGKYYGKYGTTFDNQIIVIDKTGPTPGATKAERLGNIIAISGDGLSPEEALSHLGPLGQEDIRERISRLAEQTRTATPERPIRTPRGPGRSPAAPTGQGGSQGAGRGDRDPTGSGGTQQPDLGSVERGGEQGAGGTGVGAADSNAGGRAGSTAGAGGPTGVGGDVGAADTGTDAPSDLALDEEQTQTGEEEGELFNQYVVKKARYAGALPHPANIVESSALASVNPPDVTVKLDLPAEVISEGRISDLQLEAATYAIQRHEQILPDGSRGGFWLGDGTGLGKSREIIAILWHNWRQGRRRSLWISYNNDLIGNETTGAIGDAKQVGFPGDIFPLSKTKLDGQVPDKDGVLFTAYGMAAYHWKTDKKRFNQIQDWLGPDFDGVIIFDESQKLKNSMGTAQGGAMSTTTGSDMGKMGLELQAHFPKARVVYASATAATVPRNLNYAQRIGMWGAGSPFANFIDFLQAMSRGGLGAMEMLTRDLKATGAFSGRMISFKGVQYDKDTTVRELTPYEIEQYNVLSDAWSETMRQFEAAAVRSHAGRNFKMYSQFYGAQQRFFLQLMMSYQLPMLYDHAERDLREGKSIVINLYSTNEGKVEDAMQAAMIAGMDLDDLNVSPVEILVDMIKKYFPIYEYTTVYNPATNENETVRLEDENGDPVINKENDAKKQELLAKIGELPAPNNVIDDIIFHFGAKNISELSGRKKRREPGSQGLVTRKVEGVPVDDVDKAELARFQAGKTRVAVITAKAAAGISMHSDLRSKNQQQRVFYAMQLSWSSDMQMQAFGRVHRSFQKTPPIIKLFRTNLSSQERQINAVSARLASMGALSAGGRETLGQGLFAIQDLTDDFGQAALAETYRDLAANNVDGLEASGNDIMLRMGVLRPRPNDPFPNLPTREDMTWVERFLNRLMVLHFDEQNPIFGHFYKLYERNLQSAKESGTFDVGVQKVRGQNIVRRGLPETIYTHQSGAVTQLVALEGTFPLVRTQYDDAKAPRLNRSYGGIYRNKKSGKVYAAHAANAINAETGERSVNLIGPGTGVYLGDVQELKANYEEVGLADQRAVWDAELAKVPASERKPIYMITGAIFPIYDKVVGSGNETHMRHMRVVRAVLMDGTSYIGIEVSQREINPLKQRLGIGADLATADGKLIYSLLMNKGIIVLDNGWRLRQTKVHNEPRLELDPNKVPINKEELTRYGMFSEVVGYTKRWFIPFNEADGPVVIDKLLANHKAIRDETVSGSASGGSVGAAAAAGTGGGSFTPPTPPPTDMLREAEGRLAGETPAEEATPKKEPPQAPVSPYAFGPEQEARWRASHSKPPADDKTIKAKIDELWRQMTRPFRELPRGARYAMLTDKLRELGHARGKSIDRAVTRVRDIVLGLSPDDYDLFQRKVALDDMWESYGHLPPDRKLQFAWNVVTLQADKQKIDGFVASNPRVQQALEKYVDHMNEIRVALIQAMNAIGVPIEKKLQREFYFRHMVLEHIKVQQAEHLATKQAIHAKTSGYQMKRSESTELDFLTNFVEATGDVMSRMHYDIKIAEFLGWVDKESDLNIVSDLKYQAMSLNDEKIMSYFQELADEFNAADGENVTADQLYRRTLNVQQAYGFNLFGKLASAGELPDNNGEFEELIEQMAIAYDSDTLLGSDWMKQLMRYANWILKQQEGVAGKEAAGSIFKGMAEKRAFIKEKLGRDYVTWEDLIPAGYAAFQPKEGNSFYTAYSISEQIGKQLWEGQLDEYGVDASDLSRIMAIGKKRRSMVLPIEVIKTLEGLNAPRPPNLMAKLGAWAQRQWKGSMLFLPWRLPHYLIRNWSEVDKFISAGIPQAFGRLPEAFRALKPVMIDGKPMSDEALRHYYELGGFSAAMTVSEMGDINKLEEIARLVEQLYAKPSQTDQFKKRIAALWAGYWSKVHSGSNFMEVMRRYALYLEFLEQIKSNPAGMPKTFASSIPEEVMAMDDPHRKAYRLANELLGSYDMLTEAGQHIRRYYIPFWGFQETNFVAYKRLVQRAIRDEQMTSLIARRAIGGALFRSPVWAARTGAMLAGWWGLSAMVAVVNALWNEWDDEIIEDVPEYVRAHDYIVLGRNADGSVRYFGNLGTRTDALEWFGLDQPLSDMQDLLRARRDPEQIAADWIARPPSKAINALAPWYKAPFEVMFEKTAFPSVRHPLPLRDWKEHLSEQFFGSGWIYRAVTGKPQDSLGRRLGDVFVYSSDQLESAYNETRGWKYEFAERMGKGDPVSANNEKANALYNFKLAVRKKDERAARKYHELYYTYGGTDAGMQRSVQALDPLSGLNVLERERFLSEMDPADRETVQRAYTFYYRVLGGAREVMETAPSN